MSSVSLLAAGDICPGDHYFTLGHGTGSKLADGLNPFSGIGDVLADADLTIANLEGPISSSSVRAKGPESQVFRGPPNAARVLSEAGWRLLHVANNHILQHGEEAFGECVRSLDNAGIEVVGKASTRPLESTVPVIRTVKTLRMGFLGYSFVPEVYAPGQTKYAAPSLEAAVAQIEDLRRQTDLVIVSVHWGEEGCLRPEGWTIRAANRMVEAGASVVLGHHPHVVQPVVRAGGSLIAYSLGDFLFDLFWHRRLVEGVLLKVELDENGVVAHDVVPTRLGRDYVIRHQSERAARRFLSELALNTSKLASEPTSGGPCPSPVRRLAVQIRKLVFFTRTSLRGDRSAKARFLWVKMKRLAGARIPGGARTEARGSK